MKVIDANYGIAYAYNNVIEINPVLRKYPKLYKETLNHEKEHLKSKAKVDFLLDFKNSTKLRKEWFKFMWENPKPFFQSMMPIWKDKKQWCANYFLCILYSFVLVELIIFGLVIL